MGKTAVRIWVTSLLLVLAIGVLAQDYPAITAENVAKLRPVQHIDFADFPDPPSIGWFEASRDAGEFIVIGDAGRIYRVGTSGIVESMSYRASEAQIFSLIDAVYLENEPHILYLLDCAFYINGQQFLPEYEPLALHAVSGSLYVEASAADGTKVFLPLALDSGAGELVPVASIDFPAVPADAPAVRIGRVDFPHVLISSLADHSLTAYRYPDAFSADGVHTIALTGGPAVAGAINLPGTHVVWSDPNSVRLNILDLVSGENRVVDQLDQAYAQFHLLSHDASVILIVNLDFAPAVFAWDAASGARFELGDYRHCKRIPDKVDLSADGAALIIGCDTGLEIWRIAADKES